MGAKSKPNQPGRKRTDAGLARFGKANEFNSLLQPKSKPTDFMARAGSNKSQQTPSLPPLPKGKAEPPQADVKDVENALWALDRALGHNDQRKRLAQLGRSRMEALAVEMHLMVKVYQLRLGLGLGLCHCSSCHGP